MPRAKPFEPPMKRIAYYGGTFDPVHCGHLAIAKSLIQLFRLDEFVFIPAFHAPHKPHISPTSAYHRYAMLCLATEGEPQMSVSLMEVETGEKRYSLDTLTELTAKNFVNTMFFVMGADSWSDIRTWHEWERVLLLTNHIVVTRPGYSIETSHVTEPVRRRIVDIRGYDEDGIRSIVDSASFGPRIFVTDAVRFDISATEIRDDIGADDVLDRTDAVTEAVAKYIEKYELYR